MANNSSSKNKKKVVKKVRKSVPIGQVHIQSTYNNTIVTFSDLGGNVLSWCSGGVLGYKGSRKSTEYVASQSVEAAAKQAQEFGMRQVEVYVKGPGKGKETAIRQVNACGFNIISIEDVTPVPHNGCRPPKRRRI
jgi:small subunit ribosomal protein S11